MRNPILACVLVASAALLPGCNGDSETARQPAAVSKSPAPPAEPGEAAQAAVKALINGLREGRADAFWEFLPADYQADLNALVHLFAERMDGELWSRTVAVLRKLAGVLQSQKKFLASAGPQSQALGRTQVPPAGTERAADWGQLATMLDALLDSDLAQLDRLRTADSGQLLRTAGGQLLEQLRSLSRLSPADDFAFSLDRLTELQVSVVHASTDAATLKFEAPGETPLVTKFVLHDGKWIPEALETEWLHRMGNSRAWLASALEPESLGRQKPRFLELLGAADAAFDRMGAAETAPQFAVAGQQATLTLLALFAALASPPAAEESAAPPARRLETRELVTVVVQSALDEDAQNALRGQLKAATDDPDHATAEMTGDDEVSTYRVGPVADAEAFAQRLDFLRVSGVDTANRRITARTPQTGGR